MFIRGFKMRRPLARVTIFGILFSVSLISTLNAQTKGTIKKAPLNPNFIRFLKEKANGVLKRDASGRPMSGLVPSPFLLPKALPTQVQAGSLPPSYDLRALGQLTPIKDQGYCGSCWAFAAYSSLESFSMPVDCPDFSEQHLIDNHGYVNGPCDGGNIYFASAYLSRWQGPVSESDDPYLYTQAAAPALRKHVQNILFIPERYDTSDNDLTKQAVMNYGPVWVTMSFDTANYYNAATHGYYNPDYAAPHHAVCVVGWDDNYPATNFKGLPPGNGAFICRNSWGLNWGDQGYFYVSYYDVSLALSRYCYSGVFLSEPTANYSSGYQYDPLGWTNSWGYESSYTAWGANIFSASSSTKVGAVSFYAETLNTGYEIFVYTGVTTGKPRSGVLKYSAKGSFPLPGYYTVPLSSAVAITAGQKFSVVIKFTTPGYGWPIPIEDYNSSYSENVTSHPGESFMSAFGTEWEDLYYNYNGIYPNCCIKAFTVHPAAIVVTSPAAAVSWMRGTTQTIAWTKSGTQADTVRIQLYQGTMKVSDISISTENDGSFDWVIPIKLAPRADYTVKVTTTDGKVKGTSARFAIIKPTLTVWTPAAGVVWTRGTTYTIGWTKVGPQDANVRIQLLRYGVVVRDISAGTENGTTFIWLIPTNLPKGGGYMVRVKTLDNLVKDDSALFTLN
jgi:C1A family cysteine protease